MDNFTSQLIITFVINLTAAIIAGAVCAVVPYLLGRYLNRPDMGASRAKAVVVLATVAGFFTVWQGALSLGVLAAIVFSLGIVFAKPKQKMSKSL